MRSIHRVLRRTLLVVILVAAASAGAAWADGVGVVLAPAGERISEDEALYAEALVVALVDEGRRAAFLHEASPLVRSAGVTLPSVRADDDWTPLKGTLNRIATRMRLDHVLLISLRSDDDQQFTASGLLVVRGGQGVELQAESIRERDEAASEIAARVIAAVERLPAPADGVDEAVPLPPVTVPERATPAATPPADDPAADDPAEDEAAQDDDQPVVEDLVAVEDAPPPAVVEEPAPSPEQADEAAPEGRETDPEIIDDALAEAEAAYEDGRLADAEALLNVSLRESGASARAYSLRARLSLARREQEAAIADFTRAVTIDPSLVDAQVWLGRLLAEQGLWQSAQGHYERAVETDPTHLEALLGLARLYRDHGHRRRAIRILTEAGNLGQNDPSVLLLLAELHAGDGKVALAERYFLSAAAVATGERQAAAWERLGDLYVNANRHREALTSYVKAAELNPSRAAMAERRYTEVMAAADASVHEALTATWGLFEDYAHRGVGQREIVHRRLSEMHAQLTEALRFAESINPPGKLSERHVGRQFAYSLAVEASVLALTWVDIGDASMLERAGEVHADAVRQFELLSREARD